MKHCLTGPAVLGSVHIAFPISHYVFATERRVCVILQEHFPCYVILQFVRHFGV